MIRWITPQLGTAPAGQLKPTDDEMQILDVRDLVDSEGNAVKPLAVLLSRLIEYLQQGRKVVVGCDFGMSRSNAIAAGALCLSENLPFEEAVQRVIQITGESFIKLEVLTTVRRAVEQLQPETASPPALANHQVPLVIGGGGFVGTAVLEAFSPHFPNLLAPRREKLDVYHQTFELDSLVRRNGITDLIYLAEPPVANSPEAYGAAIGTLRSALSVCRENKLRIVFLSCVDVFNGYVGRNKAIDETVEPLPSGIPAETRLLNEVLLQTYCRQQAIPYVLIRSARLFGNNSSLPRFLIRMIRKALKNEPICTHHYRNGWPQMDLLHLNDLAGGLLSLVRNGQNGIFHLGAGRLISTREMATMIIEITGSKSRLDTLELDREHANVLLDAGKASRLLDWSPQVTFAKGIKELIPLCDRTL
ncbi:MAG: sugar nucleotide-binding protein [Phycisphaerae bacterium]|nr:sugar nucleotide-binding protein [Phycisphaerae bacterium]